MHATSTPGTAGDHVGLLLANIYNWCDALFPDPKVTVNYTSSSGGNQKVEVCNHILSNLF
jgi:hypothetical protein